jgi:SAM-dependent methyltransferase
MPAFDAFAENYSFWVERVNPPNYPVWLAKFLTEKVELALDAGCGPGKLADYLADHAGRVIALDISGEMLDLVKMQIRQSGKTNISPVKGDLQSPSFKPQSFDLIASDCALHDTNLEASLAGLPALLKPGGRLVVRDLITANPRRARQPAWQVQRTLRNAQRYLRRHGARTALRLLSFELSPAWIRHNCQTGHFDSGDYRKIYNRFLPGCKILDLGWLMVAAWQAPPAIQRTGPASGPAHIAER